MELAAAVLLFAPSELRAECGRASVRPAALTTLGERLSLAPASTAMGVSALLPSVAATCMPGGCWCA